MKIRFLLITIMTAFVSSSYGFVRVGSDSISSPRAIVNKAKKEGVGISNLERREKNEIVKLKKHDPKAFLLLIGDSLSNNPQYQSYLLEVRDGLSTLEQAKMIAKLTLLNQVRKNKDILQQTMMNPSASEKWDEVEYYIKRDLNQSTVYHPSYKTKDYQFETHDWGRVTVAADLKTAKYHIDVASRFDSNRAAPYAKDFKIDESGSSLQEDDMMMPPPSDQGVIVPPLAKGEKKSDIIKNIKPKIKTK